MRTRVTFSFVAEFVGAKEDEGIFGIEGVGWFVERLSRISRLVISPRLIQEDWGVTILVERDGARFWIGLSPFGDGVWIAHIHYYLGSWVRSLFSTESRLSSLTNDLDRVLKSDPLFTDLRWYKDRDMKRPPYVWKTSPTDA